MQNNTSYLKNKQFAAEFLGVSVATVDRWVMNGRGGPRHVKIGNLVRFRPEDLQSFVEANIRGGVAA
jgi:excisionase family DNA binding protein